MPSHKLNRRCSECGGLYSGSGLANHVDHCDGEVDPDRDPRNVDPEDVDPDLLRELREEGIPIGKEADGVELPPVQELEEEDVPPEELEADGGDSCPGCGSEDLVSAAEALEQYREEADVTVAEVRQAFRAADQYCNGCQSLVGGDYDGARSLRAMFA